MNIKIILFVFILILSKIGFSQVLDDNVPMDKNEIYTYLLKKQINYLDKMKEYSTYKDDSTLFVLSDYSITKELPSYLNGRKINVINSEQLDSIFNIRAIKFVKIFPIYFKDSNIFLGCAYYGLHKENGIIYYGLSEEGILLTIKYNCETNKYELIDIR